MTQRERDILRHGYLAFASELHRQGHPVAADLAKARAEAIPGGAT